jgi:hypothetical protein
MVGQQFQFGHSGTAGVSGHLLLARKNIRLNFGRRGCGVGWSTGSRNRDDSEGN